MRAKSVSVPGRYGPREVLVGFELVRRGFERTIAAMERYVTEEESELEGRRRRRRRKGQQPEREGGAPERLSYTKHVKPFASTLRSAMRDLHMGAWKEYKGVMAWEQRVKERLEEVRKRAGEVEERREARQAERRPHRGDQPVGSEEFAERAVVDQGGSPFSETEQQPMESMKEALMEEEAGTEVDELEIGLVNYAAPPLARRLQWPDAHTLSTAERMFISRLESEREDHEKARASA